MNGEASIVSPVMRLLTVADPARTGAFYRNVLGFELTGQAGATEATHGPARIQFVVNASNPSILFFQTNDVESMRSAILTRGGLPSEIEKVNWIKMRMFQVLDPDGNVLWFGQSFHIEDDSPSWRANQPRGMRQALPELPVDDVAAAVNYYRDVLGFRINYQQDDLGVMDRDAITILLISRTEKHSGIGSFGVYVEDADALYAELSSKGARTQGPPVSHPWGLRNFQVLDLEGNRLTFSQTFE